MFSHCYAFSLFIGCCLSHCLIMWAVSECKHCVHIYCNGAEGLANWCTKLKAEAPWRFSWGVYSTRKPNFSKATAKSKTHRTQCFRSAWLSESDLDNLWQGQTKRQSSVSAQKWSAVTLQQLNLWKTWLYWVQLTFSSQQWQEVKNNNHSDHKGAVPVGVLHATVS